jgi:hypothetical protein
MKSRFPWNMPFLYCSRVFFESSRCCFHASRPVYPRLWVWQWALDERFIIPLAISHLNSQHTPRLPNSISSRNDDSTHSLRLMKHVVLDFKDPHGLIRTMIVTMQKWFTIFNLLILDREWLAIRRRRVMHRRDYDFTRLRTDFSKPSVLLHWLLLWYVDKS